MVNIAENINFTKLSEDPEVDLIEITVADDDSVYVSIKDMDEAYNGERPKEFLYSFYYGNGTFDAKIVENAVTKIYFDKDSDENEDELKTLLDEWGVKS